MEEEKMTDYQKKLKRIQERLSQEEKEELTKDYYSGMKVAEMKEKYNINIAAGKIIDLVLPEETDQKCPYCGSTMLIKRQRDNEKAVAYCASCGHIDTRTCNCVNCVKIREEEKKRKEEEFKNTIAKRYFFDANKSSLSLLSYRSKFLLGCLMQASTADSLKDIENIDKKIQLFPSIWTFQEDIDEILNVKPKIILIKKASWHYFDKDGYLEYFTLPDYTINILDEEMEELEDIYEGRLDLTDEQKVELWRKVSISRLYQYMTSLFDRMNVPYVLGAKTQYVFNELAKNFSTSQGIYIIHKSFAGASIMYAERKLQSKQHLANTVINFIGNHISKVLDEGWNTFNYDWPDDLEDSVAAQYLRKVLGISDMTEFICVPSEDELL